MNDAGNSNLPAQIADAFSAVAKGLVPGTIKSLDRLIGAAIDVPVAYLEQWKAKIDGQTESFRLVEASIARNVAAQAGGDQAIVDRAMNVLVRKEYRKQINREAVAKAMLENLGAHGSDANSVDQETPLAQPDDDWLNVFERFAEDASSERIQGLWGRVLAGEIRQPGRFSMRTLRFLSEFSQADALTFEIFAAMAFGNGTPNSLVNPPDRKDISDLIHLEAHGLIQGATGTGLRQTLTYDQNGFAMISEGDLRILLKGEPNSHIVRGIILLTPLGQELLGLLTNRDPREAARAVAMAIRGPEIHEAYLTVHEKIDGKLHSMEVLWMKEDPTDPVVEGVAE